MKKLFITLMVMFGVAAGVSAQEVGKVWVGGSIAAYSAESKLSGAKQSGFNYKIMPEVGYILTDNVSLGINVGYGKTKVDFEDGIFEGAETDVQEFIIAPFVRYTYLKADIVSLFVDGTIGYSYGKIKGDDDKINSYEVGLRPGVALNASSKVAFTAKFGFLGYQHAKHGDQKFNSYGLDMDLSNVQLGVNVFF